MSGVAVANPSASSASASSASASSSSSASAAVSLAPALAALSDPQLLQKYGHLTVRQWLQMHSQQQVDRVKAHAEGLIAKLQTDRSALETDMALWHDAWQQHAALQRNAQQM